MIMEDKQMKEMLKTAKATNEKAEKPDGYVYAYLKGKKEFFPLEKVVIASRNNMTVLELVELVERQDLFIKDELAKINKRIDEISQAKIID